ncbi:MAG: hypothetical protein ACPG49_04945 [Chitinophagales bacterium]
MAQELKTSKSETIKGRKLTDIVPAETLAQLPLFYQLLQETGKKASPQRVESLFHQEKQYLCYPFNKPISRMISFKSKQANDPK